MGSWLLLLLAAVFAYLAYDASKLVSPPDGAPYSVTAKGLGQDMSHISLTEQERLRHNNARYGLGNLNQSVWLFAALSAGSGLAAVVSFLR